MRKGIIFLVAIILLPICISLIAQTEERGHDHQGHEDHKDHEDPARFGRIRDQKTHQQRSTEAAFFE